MIAYKIILTIDGKVAKQRGDANRLFKTIDDAIDEIHEWICWSCHAGQHEIARPEIEYEAGVFYIDIGVNQFYTIAPVKIDKWVDRGQVPEVR